MAGTGAVFDTFFRAWHPQYWVRAGSDGARCLLLGSIRRHLAVRMGPPNVVIIGLGLETAGLLALGRMMTATTSI